MTTRSSSETPLEAAVDDPDAAAERAGDLLAEAGEATFRDRLGL